MSTFVLRPPLNLVLDALVNVGRPVLMSTYKPSCCIAATRLTTRVLTQLGFKATPRATWVRAGNRQFTRCLTNDIPQEEWDREGARYVEIDTASTNGYPAHLVTVCDGVLIDLSSAQFHRPDKGIHVPPYVVLDLPHDWTTAPFGFVGKRGSVVYKTLGYTPEYRGAPDWNPERTHYAAQATYEALDAKRMA